MNREESSHLHREGVCLPHREEKHSLLLIEKESTEKEKKEEEEEREEEHNLLFRKKESALSLSLSVSLFLPRRETLAHLHRGGVCLLYIMGRGRFSPGGGNAQRTSENL